jgi:hypothetical protein
MTIFPYWSEVTMTSFTCCHLRPSDNGQGTVKTSRQDSSMRDQPALVNAAISRLVGDDPLARVILAAVVAEHVDSFAGHAALAIASDPFDDALDHARRLATSRRQRQHLAIIDCWLHGDTHRSHDLSREHLAEFPDDIVVSWLTSKR